MADRPRGSWLDRIAWLIGSGFGCGLSPLAPGTVGSLAAGVVLYLASLALPADWTRWQSLAVPAGLSIAGMAVGVWATGRMSSDDDPDPGSATWDEYVGMWITCLAIPWNSIPWLLGAFVVFRAFDVLKPWPCRRLENLHGGWGIMLDDVAAGGWGAMVMVGAGLILSESGFTGF